MTGTRVQMRSYRRNSPQAAARIVALALVANGRIKASELAVLDALEAHDRLGLSGSQWQRVMSELCEDLLGPTHAGETGCITGQALSRLLDEVDDEILQRDVLRLCAAVVQADRQVDDGEAYVLLAAMAHWGLQPDDASLVEPLLYGADFEVRPRGAVLKQGALPLGALPLQFAP